MFKVFYNGVSAVFQGFFRDCPVKTKFAKSIRKVDFRGGGMNPTNPTLPEQVASEINAQWIFMG